MPAGVVLLLAHAGHILADAAIFGVPVGMVVGTQERMVVGTLDVVVGSIQAVAVGSIQAVGSKLVVEDNILA